MIVPQVLRDKPNWVLWQGSKVPCQVNGKPASVSNPSTWTTFDSAFAAQNRFSGLGFVFDGSGIFGIDLDGCIDDNGVVQDWALQIVQQFGSYTEYSPSGHGLHIYGLGKIPDGKGKKIGVPGNAISGRKPGIEFYDRGRYFCFTGKHFPGTPEMLSTCQTALDLILKKIENEKTQDVKKMPVFAGFPSCPPLDDFVIERARRYLSAMAPVKVGERNTTLFRAADSLVRGFNLSIEQATPLLRDWAVAEIPSYFEEGKKVEQEISRTIANANSLTGPRGWLVDGRGYTGDDVDLRPLLASLTPKPQVIETEEVATEVVPVESAKPVFVKSEPKIEFPQECIDGMPKLMRMAYDYVLKTATRPQPKITLGALIALFGAVFGHKVKDDYGTRTNIMVMVLAPSGAGKDHPRQVNKMILEKTGLDHINGPESIESHTGVINELVRHPVILFQWDEFGLLLNVIKKASSAPWLAKVPGVLMQLWSSSSVSWIGGAKAKNVPRIKQPCACAFGTSVPGNFYDGLTVENLTEGLLSRMIVIESEYGKRQKPDHSDPLPNDLLQEIRRWHAQNWNPDGGNLQSVNPNPKLVPKTLEANLRHERYCDEVNAHHPKEDELHRALWSRAPEKAAKLALIYACCDAMGCEPEITVEAIEWAIKLVNYSTRSVITNAINVVSSSIYEKEMKAVWNALEKKMTLNELAKKTPGMSSELRRKFLRDLEELEAIHQEPIATGKPGRPTTIIYKLRDTLTGNEKNELL